VLGRCRHACVLEPAALADTLVRIAEGRAAPLWSARVVCGDSRQFGRAAVEEGSGA
jgi:hypothetical protein